MARKSYQQPSIVMINPDGPGDDNVTGSQQTPYPIPVNSSFSAWRMAVQNANLDIDQSYAGYVDWMVKNGYAAYIQPDDSELQ
ncbi:MAG: hypothetical protein IJU46_07000 [Clostridia bacterium]|nr:hypothetical protein [Clostridia bacterium]